MVGQLVRTRREARGWSQTELAERATRLGGIIIRQGYVSRLESGEIGLPQRATREALGKALALSQADWLYASGEFDPELALKALPDGTEGVVGDFVRWLTSQEGLLARLETMRKESGERVYRRYLNEVLFPAWLSNANATMGALHLLDGASDT